MTYDDLRKTWQAQGSGFRLSIDSGQLLREVQRNKKHFEVIVFWRDVREVGVAIATCVVSVYWGLKDGVWPLVVLGVLVLGVGIFMIVDRAIQKRRRPVSGKPLMSCIERSLAQVDHQVWLLKNVFWWYLLPPGIGAAIVLSYAGWGLRGWGMGWLVVLAMTVFCSLIFLGVYCLNQYAVRKELGPRKEELEELLKSLRDAD